jgi:hypothetical protein
MHKLIILIISFSFCGFASAQFTEGAPVNMTISPKVSIPGKPINIKGNTAVAKEEVTITVKITRPDGKEEVRHQATVNKGNFDLNISNTKATGRYFVTGISADEKTTTIDSFFITTPAGLATDYQNVLFKVAFLSQKATDLALERCNCIAGYAGAYAKDHRNAGPESESYRNKSNCRGSAINQSANTLRS